MGWCSGTSIFDNVIDAIFKCAVSYDEKVTIIKALAIALEEHDWDCQSDSVFYSDPVVVKVFRDIHPEWFSPKQSILDIIQSFRDRKLIFQTSINYKEVSTLLDEIQSAVKREDDD